MRHGTRLGSTTSYIRTASTLAAAAAVILAVAACGTGSPPSAGGAPATTAASQPEPEQTGSSGDADCLIGDWTISDAELDRWWDMLGRVITEHPPHGTGTVALSFDETSFTFRPDATIEYDNAEGGAAVGVFRGEQSGPYEIVDGTVQTPDATNALDWTWEHRGEVLPYESMFGEFTSPSLLHDATWDCSGGSPVITLFATALAPRVPVTLEPRA